MRIAFLHTSFATCGGIERVWIEKMNYLATHFGYDIVMVTSDQGSHPMSFPVDERVRHIDMNIGMHTQYRYSGLRRLQKRRQLSRQYEERLRQLLLDVRPDILVCTSTQDMRQLLRLKGNTPVIVEGNINFAHDGTLWNKLLTRYNNHYVGKADAVVTLTNGDAKNWRKVSKNVHVIPNFVHLNDTGSISDCSSKKAVFIGRLVKEKGLDDMTSIWRQVNAQHPDWQLHLYGEGTMDSVPTSSSLYILPQPPPLSATRRAHCCCSPQSSSLSAWSCPRRCRAAFPWCPTTVPTVLPLLSAMARTASSSLTATSSCM